MLVIVDRDRQIVNALNQTLPTALWLRVSYGDSLFQQPIQPCVLRVLEDDARHLLGSFIGGEIPERFSST